jgi:uncharacterized SAM-binding protein YcdF (DUF218 family)
MRRAEASFKRAGLDLAPWPADFRAPHPLVASVFDFVPNAEALGLTTTALKEFIGLWVYRWRGWI